MPQVDPTAKLSVIGKRFFRLIEFDADEELVTEIRKDPFGLFVNYLIGIFIAVILLVAGLFITYSGASARFFGDLGMNMSRFQTIGFIITMFLVGVVLVATIINGILYQSNVIFVTSEKIAQILYNTLFDRKISQLSIGDVQDVTVTQNGILPRLFNYGTLVVETAGEQQNYTFTYIPKPYDQSKAIVGAHERNMVKHGN